ncbi:MAG: mRNA surveillance protein pelota [Crenarchaeota archaeon]|nr:mRNA surveillance protein pelota [Thermoproteota archaeon]
MKILDKDLRKGIVKLVPEDQDDMWILYNIIAPGDLVTAQTTRDIKVEGSSRRVPMILTIQVKALEFQPFTDRLRIRGIVVEGPERFGVKGHYHTINVEPGKPIVINKERWPAHILKRIEDAMKRRPRILLVAIDYDDVAIALLSEQGVKILYEEALRLPGKSDTADFDKMLAKFLDKISKIIADYVSRYRTKYVIIGSPSMLRQNLARILKDRIAGVSVVIDNVSMGGAPGIRELMRRDSVKEALKEASLMRAQEALAEFRRLLMTNDKMVVYGIDDVERAVSLNAVEKIIVSEDLLRTYNEDVRKRVDRILEEAYRRRAEIIVVPKESQVYYEIEGLGGIAGILRFPIS